VDTRVSPDELDAAAVRTAGDGDTFRTLAGHLADAAGRAAAGTIDAPPLGAALGDLLEAAGMALRTLGLAADVLTEGLTTAAREYASVDRSAAGLFGALDDG
jgi:hypothetical protein